jgi:uncharacterized protein YneR
LVENEKPEDFYYNFFLLVTCYGILFENFLVSSGSEGNFTKNIVLPVFDKIYQVTGVKPLIVPIPPMEIENEDFWYFHDEKIKQIINNK